MNPLQPDPRAISAETVLEPRLLDERKQLRRHAPPAPLRVTRQEARQALRVAAIAPFADRRTTQGEVARRRLQPVLLRISEDPEALFHSDAVLGWNLDLGHRCSPRSTKMRR